MSFVKSWKFDMNVTDMHPRTYIKENIMNPGREGMEAVRALSPLFSNLSIIEIQV